MMTRKSVEIMEEALKHEGDVSEWFREYVDFHNRVHDTSPVHAHTVLSTDDAMPES